MRALQVIAILIALGLTVVAVVLTVRAVRSILGVLRTGQPSLPRSTNPVGRSVTMVKETFLHTRMLQWTVVGVMHWFVYLGFIVLSGAVFTGYFQLFDQDFALPILGHFFLYEWVDDILGVLSTVGIVYLIIYRQQHHPRREGRNSRFYRSTFWQAYFVEIMALLEGALILFIRGAEYNLGKVHGDNPDHYTKFHFPISAYFGHLYPTSIAGSEKAIILIALLKITLAMVWIIVIAKNLTMGVAWHRFTAWPNIWFKRDPTGRTALGAIKPLTVAGKAITLDDIDDLDEDSKLGVGAVEDFSWKNILDFTTCTECGRCQSQCPAWNTEKPLNPKLLITALRDATYAKAPYNQAAEADREALISGDSATAVALRKEVDRPLIGDTGDEWFYMPESGAAVIDPDVLWNCTSCGACVQQCPVDIEHVDHIMDMRRYAVLVESNFPAELNGLFKGLENKGNPWNMSTTARLDWTKGLDFEVKVVGDTIESLDEVDWLFWVGCAGAYEDRAKKTTRAVAELLERAGVSFGVLGNGETCTGDPARRAGNEFVFQGLAQQNVETLKEAKVKQVVTTCAHCFNTLKNEYQEFGIELEVTHHTQLLNRLVREGKLTPVASGEGAHKRSITYHDPCYIGRHNGVYTPPRELLQVLPGADFVEMPRNSEKSFCCGAGGARMWMEENLGTRINVNRTTEAVATGADQIAVGCPFCRVMLSDGLTSAQANGEAREEVEVLDIAQMLLASVRGEVATKVKPGGAASANAAPVESTEQAATEGKAGSVETKDEPEAGDVTVTEDTVTATEDVGPLAKASGGSSLFDDAGDDAGSATEATAPKAAPAAKSGGSLFDDAGDDAGSATEATAPKAAPAAKSGGSLFDTPEPEAEPAAEADPAAAEPAAAEPAEDTSEPEVSAPAKATGGSLFDVEADAPAAAEADPEPEAPAATKTETKPAADLGGGGSLFDIPAAQEPATPAEPAAEAEPAATVAPAAEPDATEDPAQDAPEADAEPPAPVDADPAPEPEPAPEAEATASEVDLDSGGSLFDIPAAAPAAAAPSPEAPAEVAPKAEVEAEAAADETDEPEAASEPEPEPEPEPSVAETKPTTDLSGSGSLFDIAAPEPPAAAEPAATAEAEADATPQAEPASATPAPEPTAVKKRGSLFDIAAPAARATPAAAPPPEAEAAPEPEPVVEADAEPVANADAEPAAEAEPEPGAKAEPESTHEVDAEAEPEPSADAGTDTDAEDAGDGGAGGGSAVTQTDFATSDTWPAGEAPTAATPEQSDEADGAEADGVVPDETAEAEAIEVETPDDTAESEDASEDTGEDTAEDDGDDGDQATTEEPTAAAADAHTPRTDADISEAGSLFDL